jgi:hypothetical protein
VGHAFDIFDSFLGKLFEEIGTDAAMKKDDSSLPLTTQSP